MKNIFKRDSQNSTRKNLLADFFDINFEALSELISKRHRRDFVEMLPTQNKDPSWMVRTSPGRFYIDVEAMAKDKKYLAKPGALGVLEKLQTIRALNTAQHGFSTVRKPDGSTFNLSGKPKDCPLPIVSFTPPASPAAPSPSL